MIFLSSGVARQHRKARGDNITFAALWIFKHKVL